MTEHSIQVINYNFGSAKVLMFNPPISMHNPALREEPRHRPAAVIPLQQEPSILNWLQSTGRLLPRDAKDDQYGLEAEGDINELMGVDDTFVDDVDIDDDDSDIALDEE